MKQRVIIVTPYLGVIDSEFQNRFLDLGRCLSQDYGLDVALVTSSFCHVSKTRHRVRAEMPFRIEFLDCGSYRNTSLKRFIHNLLFALKLLFVLRRIPKKKEVSVVIAYPFVSSLFSMLPYRKRFRKVVIDVQDLWPESFRVIFPNISESQLNMLTFPFTLVNKLIFPRFSNYVFVSKTFQSHFAAKYNCAGGSHVCYIGNRPTSNFGVLPVFPEKVCRIVYVGSLEKSYDLMPVIDAIDILNRSGAFELHVFGSGSNLRKYKAYARQAPAVRFHGNVAISALKEALPEYNVAVNPILKESAASIINKHADYSLAGLPVVNTQCSEEYVELLELHGAGLTCDLTADAVANAILEIVCQKNEYETFCRGSLSMYSAFNRDFTLRSYADYLLDAAAGGVPE